MLNIHASVQTLLSAEKVVLCKHLTADERVSLLEALRDTVTTIPSLTAPHAQLVLNAITRMIDSERPRNSAAQKQGRTAQGVKEPAQVAAERAEEGSEASSGASKGGEEPAEDAGRTDRAKPRKVRQPTASPAPEAAEA